MTGRSLNAIDARACPCISWRFGHAEYYRRRNKSKSERTGLAICYSPPRERKLHKSLRANDVLPRAGETLCHLVLVSVDTAKSESPFSSSSCNRTGDKMEIAGESILRSRSW